MARACVYQDERVSASEDPTGGASESGQRLYNKRERFRVAAITAANSESAFRSTLECFNLGDIPSHIRKY